MHPIWSKTNPTEKNASKAMEHSSEARQCCAIVPFPLGRQRVSSTITYWGPGTCQQVARLWGKGARHSCCLSDDLDVRGVQLGGAGEGIIKVFTMHRGQSGKQRVLRELGEG